MAQIEGMEVLKEGWLVKRRVDQSRLSTKRVYARLSPDKLLWYPDDTSSEPCGGVHLLGRYVVRVDPAQECSAYATMHDPAHEQIIPQFLILDTANYSSNYEFECRTEDGDTAEWQAAIMARASADCGSYQPPVEVCDKISRLYGAIENLCVLAGTHPNTLMEPSPHLRTDFMNNRTQGLVVLNKYEGAPAKALEFLVQIAEMLVMTGDAARDREIMFLKSVGTKLGVFCVMANFINASHEKVYMNACYNISRMTVLSVEMTEKALPVMPTLLAKLNAGVDAMDGTARYWVMMNLIKGPAVMRKLIAVGFPSYIVRLLRRVWEGAGHPEETVDTETGFRSGLDEETLKLYTDMETWCTMAVLQMLVHGPEVREAVELSGVKEALSVYLVNPKRLNLYLILAMVGLMDRNRPDPALSAFVQAPCPPLGWLSVQIDPETGERETVVEVIMHRFMLACLGQPEGPRKQSEAEPVTDAGEATDETEKPNKPASTATVNRFYDLSEVVPSILGLSHMHVDIRLRLIHSPLIEGCFSALKTLEASLHPTTQFRGRQSIVSVLNALSFCNDGRAAVAAVDQAFERLKAAVERQDDARGCTYESSEDSGIISDSDKAEFVRDVTGLVFRLFPDRSAELSGKKLDTELLAPSPAASAWRRTSPAAVRRQSKSVTSLEHVGQGNQGGQGSEAPLAMTEDGPSFDVPPPPEEDEDDEHCMISYCWADQPFVLKLADSLRSRGIKVWVDVDNMSGSTLEAMASAVENAYAVVVVLSEAYKNSTACRTEAEYAYTLKKNIVPVKNNEGFTASGWLGALMGTKLWFNFGGLMRAQWEQKVSALLTEVHRVAKRVAPSTTTGMLPPSASASSDPSAPGNAHGEGSLSRVASTHDTDEGSDADHSGHGVAESEGGHPAHRASGKTLHAWQTATHAVLHGHAPVALHDLESAVHNAVSARLREIFVAVSHQGGATAAASGSGEALAQQQSSSQKAVPDAFLNHMLEGT